MRKMTFIMPCFNEVEHTKKGVQSILDNSPSDMINFLFIDNGSRDSTPDFLRTVPSSHIITNKTNNFVNPAWNQGFKHILDYDLGEYVCLTNNDITVGRSWLDPIFHLFEEDVGAFYLPMSNTQEDPAFHNESEFHKYTDEAWQKPLSLRRVNVPFVGFCFFIRKQHVQYFYPIPEEMKVLRGDDWITDCLAFNGIFPYRVSRCAVHHFGGATQRGMPIHGLRNNDAQVFDKICATTYKQMGMGRINENKMKWVPHL